MLRRDAVGAGAGDHLEVSWTLASPAMERNPRPWDKNVSKETWKKVQVHRRACQTSVWMTSRSLPCVTPPAAPPAAPIRALLPPPKLKAMAAANVALFGGRSWPSEAGSGHGRVGGLAGGNAGAASASAQRARVGRQLTRSRCTQLSNAVELLKFSELRVPKDASCGLDAPRGVRRLKKDYDGVVV